MREKKKKTFFFCTTNTYVKLQAFKIPEAFPDYKYTALIMWLSLCGLYTIETLAGIFFYNDEKKVYGLSNRFTYRYIRFMPYSRRLILCEVYRSVLMNFRRPFNSLTATQQKWNNYRTGTVTKWIQNPMYETSIANILLLLLILYYYISTVIIS